MASPVRPTVSAVPNALWLITLDTQYKTQFEPKWRRDDEVDVDGGEGEVEESFPFLVLCPFGTLPVLSFSAFFLFSAASDSSCSFVLAEKSNLRKPSAKPVFVKQSASCHLEGTH